MSRIYIVVNKQPNAFANGQNLENANVAATTVLVARISSEELAGDGHELAHVKNCDTLNMIITGAISMVANMTLLAGLSGRNDNRDNPLGKLGRF
jgi:heat shock protein HtpX